MSVHIKCETVLQNNPVASNLITSIQSFLDSKSNLCSAPVNWAYQILRFVVLTAMETWILTSVWCSHTCPWESYNHKKVYTAKQHRSCEFKPIVLLIIFTTINKFNVMKIIILEWLDNLYYKRNIKSCIFFVAHIRFSDHMLSKLSLKKLRDIWS